MKNPRRVIGIIFAILLVVWAAVIFSFSLRSGAVSHGESGFVEKVLSAIAKRLNLHIDHRFYQIFAPFLEDKNNITTEEVVRKVGHFTEYFIFGLLCGSVSLYFQKRSKLWFIPLLCGIFVSFIDERIIQLYLVTGRTSSFMDVLLDCIGFYCAIVICVLIAAIAAAIAAATRRKKLKIKK